MGGDCKCGGWEVGGGGVPHGQQSWAFTPSGGGDMEIQKKACLIYNAATSSVCLRHN